MGFARAECGLLQERDDLIVAYHRAAPAVRPAMRQYIGFEDVQRIGRGQMPVNVDHHRIHPRRNTRNKCDALPYLSPMPINVNRRFQWNRHSCPRPRDLDSTPGDRTRPITITFPLASFSFDLAPATS